MGHAFKDASISFSGEFVSSAAEKSYLQFSWNDIRKGTHLTLLVVAFMGFSFFIVDLISAADRASVLRLLGVRLGAVTLIVAGAEYIRRQKFYFEAYPFIVVGVQVVIALSIFMLAIERHMPAIYVGVDAILFTLVYYQFLANRLDCTVFACLFMGFGSVVVGYFYLSLPLAEFIGAFLFLIPLNFLGIAILSAINRTRRGAYLALMASQRDIKEKEQLIARLHGALGEVKTLEGLIPICAKCHKIRDDKGFWERIEKYIQDRTEAQFSHSLCPDCAKGLYGDLLNKNKPPAVNR
jgi:hypothetical protein